jgi:putative iron-only hydrogenase system regulator
MEKRIGAAIILIQEKTSIPELNAILNVHSDIIIARQGLPLSDRNFNIISLVLEGTTDAISSLTGKIGKLENMQVKSVLTKTNVENENKENLG